MTPPGSLLQPTLLQITFLTLKRNHRLNLTQHGTSEHTALAAAITAWKTIEGVQRVSVGKSLEDENVLVVVLGM